MGSEIVVEILTVNKKCQDRVVEGCEESSLLSDCQPIVSFKRYLKEMLKCMDMFQRYV